MLKQRTLSNRNNDVIYHSKKIQRIKNLFDIKPTNRHIFRQYVKNMYTSSQRMPLWGFLS